MASVAPEPERAATRRKLPALTERPHRPSRTSTLTAVCCTRCDTTPAMSSGFRKNDSGLSAIAARVRGRSTTPSTMIRLTCTPFGPSSLASDCARLRCAALAGAKAAVFTLPRSDAVAPMKTRFPSPAATIAGATRRAATSEPTARMRSAASSWAGVTSSARSRTSPRPRCRRACGLASSSAATRGVEARVERRHVGRVRAAIAIAPESSFASALERSVRRDSIATCKSRLPRADARWLRRSPGRSRPRLRLYDPPATSPCFTSPPRSMPNGMARSRSRTLRAAAPAAARAGFKPQSRRRRILVLARARRGRAQVRSRKRARRNRARDHSQHLRLRDGARLVHRVVVLLELERVRRGHVGHAREAVVDGGRRQALLCERERELNGHGDRHRRTAVVLPRRANQRPSGGGALVRDGERVLTPDDRLPAHAAHGDVVAVRVVHVDDHGRSRCRRWAAPSRAARRRSRRGPGASRACARSGRGARACGKREAQQRRPREAAGLVHVPHHSSPIGSGQRAAHSTSAQLRKHARERVDASVLNVSPVA